MDNQNDQNNLNQDNTTNPAVVSDPVIPINQDTPPPPPVLENPVSQTPVTEELPSFSQVDSTSSDSFPIPTVEEVPEDTGSAAPDLDIPTTISTDNKPKKQFGGKAIATILGVLVLIGGIGAGVILVRQQQDMRSKAMIPKELINNSTSDTNTAPLPVDNSSANTAPLPVDNTSGAALMGNYCSYDSKETKDCKTTQGCPGTQTRTCNVYVDPAVALGYYTWGVYSSCVDKSGDYCPSTSCDTSLLMVDNQNCGECGHVCQVGWVCSAGDCIQVNNTTGGSNPELTCVGEGGLRGVCVNGLNCTSGYRKLSDSSCGTNKVCCITQTGGGEGSCTVSGIGGTCTSWNYCPSEKTWSVDTECPNGGCCYSSASGGGSSSSGSSSTSTNPPTSTLSASCLNIKAYNSSWTLLSASDLSNLKSGDIVRFAVAGTATSGSFDKAKFTINGVARSEVTTKKTGTEEYYDEYTIPSGITSFTINAQIHHTTKGWI